MERKFLLKDLVCPNCSAKIEKEIGELEGIDSSKYNLMTQTLTLEVNDNEPKNLLKKIDDIVKSHEDGVTVSEITKAASAAAASESECHDEHCHCHDHEHEHGECHCHEHEHEHGECQCHDEHCHCHDHDDDDEDGCCCCCGGHVDTSKVPEKGLTEKQKKDLIKIAIALVALIIIKLLENVIPTFYSSVFGLDAAGAASASYWTNLILYGIDYLYIGHKVLLKAWKNIKRGQIFDENFLMCVATLGAVFLGIVSNGEFTEAVAVMIFYSLGEWFEGYAVGRSRKNITDLMDIRPDYANVERDGELVQVDPNTLEIGSIIVVQPGEKIPLDGVVVEGESSLDTSALTGESVPRMAKPGEEVISGCICSTGVLKIKTTKRFSESTVSKILELVENASDRKSRSEAFITRFAKYYTPCVCIAALCLAVLPNIIIPLAGGTTEWFDWVYRALTFLVISCPCALVISIPLSFFAGIGCASKNGVLVKGSNYLEALSKLDTVVFDKTGTLTQGVFKVVEVDLASTFESHPEQSEGSIEGSELDEKKLLYFAAHAESASSHPIAKSIVTAFGEKVTRESIKDLKEISAQGVEAKVDGHDVKVGKPGFVAEGIDTSRYAETAGSNVYVSIDGKYAGAIVISDVVKETSAQALKDLKAEGIRKTVMLTGDNENTAKIVAGQLGLDEVHANLLPENKVEQVEKMRDELGSEDGKRLVGFVGDGINDAPVLMRADVGVAMGAMGSDAAIEAADVVLMDDNPLSIAKALRVAKKAMRIVRENIVFALGVKGICLILGALGIANMYLAIFADVGVMIIAVLNAMRALRIKIK